MACGQGVPSGFCSPRPCIAHGGRCLTLRCRKDKARREETSNRSCSKLFLTEPPPWPPKPFQLEQRPTGSRSGKPTLLPGKAKGLGQGPLPPRLAPTPPRQRPAPTASLASGLQTPAQPTLSGGPTSPGLATVLPPLGSTVSQRPAAPVRGSATATGPLPASQVLPLICPLPEFLFPV